MDMPTPDYQQFTRMWLDFASKMATAATNTSATSIPADVAKQLRDTYFQAIGQYTEEYMRSPQFLAFMKQSTDAAVAMRQQTNELLAQAHHAVGGLARPDIDSLLMAIRRCETRVLDKLDELSSRIDTLELDMKATETSEEKPARKSR